VCLLELLASFILLGPRIAPREPTAAASQSLGSFISIGDKVNYLRHRLFDVIALTSKLKPWVKLDRGPLMAQSRCQPVTQVASVLERIADAFTSGCLMSFSVLIDFPYQKSRSPIDYQKYNYY
jgi:hypothetical protein